MSRWAYVNGRYVRHRAARVHVEDRGYQFADGVYEVIQVVGGHLIDGRRHLDRLDRSLRELAIRAPMTRAALLQVLREMVMRNRLHDGLVYLQVTRGVARRDHVFPSAATEPALVVTARGIDPRAGERIAENGIAVVTLPDNRWDRVDIKSVSLLPNVLAREMARQAGAKEAWFVDRDGMVTEGAATNAW
ncbi:MAG: aminotransferase class IV, partial [Hyphomicrobiales bacterium]|nr:aminotransferase class IV [Hyphomicrobiales bacterium]